jgi:hypothetical protein
MVNGYLKDSKYPESYAGVELGRREMKWVWCLWNDAPVAGAKVLVIVFNVEGPVAVAWSHLTATCDGTLVEWPVFS